MFQGRVTDSQVVAAIAIDELKLLEIIDGGDGSGVPSYEAMNRFTRTLRRDESHHANRELDAPNGRGYVPSHDIKRRI